MRPTPVAIPRSRCLHLLATLVATLFMHLTCLAAPPCNRIVSLAPSATEVLYAVGLGSSLVGVTRFDHYPPEVEAITKVGGMLDPNIEQITMLAPRLIVILAEQQDLARSLTALGLSVLPVEHRSVTGILDSLRAIGARCGREEEAERVRRRLQGVVHGVQQRVSHLPRVKTVVILGREDPERLGTIFVSGRDGFYTELLAMAGGENVYKSTTMAVPSMSEEGVLALAPEAIIEIVTPPEPEHAIAHRRGSWREVRGLAAAQAGRVLVIGEDYAAIPGPRFVLLLEKIASFLHPR